MRALHTLAWLLLLSGLSPAQPLFEPASVAVAELKAGESLPDVELQGAPGTPLHLSGFQGQALALTFIYTRCPAPTYCPMVSRNFDAVQALLSRLGVQKRCHLLSITLDPEHDTCAVLSAYAEACHADPELWSFARTREGELRRLGSAVGLEYKEANGVIDHNLRTVVLDGAGRIRHIFRGDQWTPQELAAELRAAAPRVP